MQPAKKLPSHDVFITSEVSEEDRKKGVKPFWNKIGAAWEHQDGLGYNVQLSALPLDGRIVMRFNKPKEDEKPDPREDSRYGRSDYSNQTKGR